MGGLEEWGQASLIGVIGEGKLKAQRWKDRRRKTEGRRQKTEDRRRKTEGGGQKTEYTVRRTYDLPFTPGEEQALVLEVSRTWIPHEHLKNFDRRELGGGS